VLFLPGCPDSRWAAWLGDAPARAAGVRLVAVNRPGYGASPRRPVGHLGVARQLCAVADELGAERFGILGMSVGGTYALACAASHPDRVSRVVTVSSPGEVASMVPPHHRDGASADEMAQLEAVREGSVEEAVALLRRDFEEYAATVLGEEGADPQDVARRLLDGLPEADAALLSAVPATVVARQAREALCCPDGYLHDAAAMLRRWELGVRAVRCPVRVVHGALDTAASPRNSHWLAGHVPGATLELLPGTTHLGALHEHWPSLLSWLRAG
jgi:pimeloyl-ACP methyl ester carboxylesterase